MSDMEPQEPTWIKDARLNVGKARSFAEESLQQTSALSDFIMWTNAARRLNPEQADLWDEQDVEGASTEDWLASYTRSADRKKSEKLAKVAEELLREIGLDQLSDQARVVLSKSPGSTFGSEYYALGIFPGVVIYDVKRLQEPKKDIIFMKFGAGCNEQAIEEILAGKDRTKFATEDADLPRLYSDLGFDVTKGVQQNFRHRDEQGNVTGTREAQKYILYALKGGFGNEDERFLLSDFSKNTNAKQNNKPL